MNNIEKERGNNRDGNRDGNGEGRPAGPEWGRERQKGRQAQMRRTAGAGGKKESVGRGCVGVLGVVQGGRCQLGSAPTISVTVVTGDWSWR